MHSAELVLIDGPEAGRIVPWAGKPLTIGRTRGNVLVLPDQAVSRQHARLFERDGRYFLVDLNSTHGTQVNGAKVTRHELRPGDRIVLGETTILFRLAGDPHGTLRPEPLDSPAGEDADFELQMPDQLLPSVKAPADRDPAPRPAITAEGEDPFADDEPAPPRAAPPPPVPSSPGAPSRPSPQPTGGVGSLYRPRKPAAAASGGLRVLYDELDQRGPIARAAALLVAVALALGLCFGAMKVASLGGGEGELPDELRPEPQGPNRPLRAPPR